MKSDPTITITVTSNHPDIESIMAFHAASIDKALGEGNIYVSNVDFTVVRHENWHRPT